MKSVLMFAVIEACPMFKAYMPADHTITKYDRETIVRAATQCKVRYNSCLTLFTIKPDLAYRVICGGK